MVNMNELSAWHDRRTLIEHLAKELVRGRLGVILGAGVSASFGLPTWVTLVERLCRVCGEPAGGAADDPILKIGALRSRHYANDPARFLNDVRTALYDGISIDFNRLREHDLLVAIGALLTSSIRGSASDVITFNFDDILEIYLQYYGGVTRAIYSERYWTGNQDVTIFHPHGFLPFDEIGMRSSDLVFGIQEFLRILDTSTANIWRSTLITLLRTKTYIHVGLSGDDIHLQSLLQSAYASHAIRDERILFCGLRFSLRGSHNPDKQTMMERWGVSTFILDDYNELPTFLIEICQEARRIRAEIDSM